MTVDNELERLQAVERDYQAFRQVVMETAFALKEQGLPGAANDLLEPLCVFPAPHRVVAPHPKAS